MLAGLGGGLEGGRRCEFGCDGGPGVLFQRHFSAVLGVLATMGGNGEGELRPAKERTPWNQDQWTAQPAPTAIAATGRLRCLRYACGR
jgi:hypothetical protein